ncbi:polysaccharide deacetylase family protein [Actinocorallia longicatena]|uniref:Polysaccharide deacetylase family protein n=1 Tax=Actinocorallia longicatena TaxID=111803 RepID=A0ABP6QEN7_9ACTN
MRAGFPLLSSVLAAVVAVAAGVWPALRVTAFDGLSGAKMEKETASPFAGKTWPKAAPGSFTPAPAATDGLATVVTRIQTQEKVVFLTIDDGYEYDADFVKMVRDQGVPIMTFLTTVYVPQHGPYFWSLQHAGSAMENHTVNHKDLKSLGPEGQKTEICGASDTIEKVYGRRPTTFRPPFGSYNDITRRVVGECGMKSVILWSAEFCNGATVCSPNRKENEFVRGDGGTGFKPGDIILMHYRKGLAQQFGMLLDWIKQAGYRPAALQEYLPVRLGGNAPDAQPAKP